MSLLGHGFFIFVLILTGVFMSGALSIATLMKRVASRTKTGLVKIGDSITVSDDGIINLTGVPYANFIDNGGFSVRTRGTGSSAITNNKFITDRWKHITNLSGSISATVQYTGFDPYTKYDLVYYVTTANTDINTNKYMCYQTTLEGSRIVGLLNKPLHLSFYFETNKMGMYSVAFLNGKYGSAKSYIAKFEVTSTGKNLYKIPLPVLMDTTAQDWPTDISGTLIIRFCLAAGPDVQGAEGVWHNNTPNNNLTTKMAVASQVNFLDTVGNYCKITGIQLQAFGYTPFERKPEAYEELMCMRYAEGALIGSSFWPVTLADIYDPNAPWNPPIWTGTSFGQSFYTTYNYSVRKRYDPTIEITTEYTSYSNCYPNFKQALPSFMTCSYSATDSNTYAGFNESMIIHCDF
jgi:hypothetical protein